MTKTLFYHLFYAEEIERIVEERARFQIELKRARELIEDYRAKLEEQEKKVERYRDWIVCS